MQKKIIIIGAGLSGLTTGIYARLCGLDATILEKNHQIGGLCAIKDNISDRVIGFNPFLYGISKQTKSNRLWKELGIIDKQDFVIPNEFNAVRKEDGHFFHVYTDLDSLKKEMLSHSKKDESLIETFIEDIQSLSQIDLPLDRPYKDVRNYWMLRKFKERYKLPPWKFALRFESKELADLFTYAFDKQDQSLFLSLWELASLAKSNSGILPGGSVGLIKNLENVFFKMGGKIKTGTTVSKIMIKRNRAVGVLVGGKEPIFSDAVISCADGYSTLFDWIGEKYISFPLKEIYKKLSISTPVCLLNIQVKGSYDDLPIRFVLRYPTGVKIEYTWLDHLTIEKTNLENDIHPKLTIFQVMFPTVWRNWNEDWLQDESQISLIQQNICKALEASFPGIKDNIVSIQFVSPKTIHQYTSNRYGSYHGFLMKEKKYLVQIPQNLPLLKRFYMAGQWTTLGGGIYESAHSGRNAIRNLCHEMKVPFIIPDQVLL